MVYLAKKDRLIRSIQTDAQLDQFVADGCTILRREYSGTTHEDVVLAENGEWLAPRPTIEVTGEYIPEAPPDLTARIDQTAADIAYLSMMTGVNL